MLVNPRHIASSVCNASFYEFVKYTMFRGFKDNWHIKLICDELQAFYEAVERKESPRLIIEAPPRHTKSETCSIRFPAWCFGKNPSIKVIATSNTSTLSEKFNSDIRNLMKSKKYSDIFPATRLPKSFDSKIQGLDKKESQTYFDIYHEHGGYYLNTGVRGSITGYGADILLIDDPIKNSEEMNSITIKDKNEEWYQTTANSRVHEGGGIIIIATRWCVDDLTGRVLENEEKKKDDPHLKRFKIIRLPAIAEEDEYFNGELKRKKGEALHPSYRSLESLYGIKSVIIPRHWSALYQQNPILREGGFYQREWFEVVDFIKQDPIVRKIRYWDRAGTEKLANNHPDYTVGLLLAKTKSGILYVMDIRRFQSTPYQSRVKIRNTAEQDGTDTVIWQEQEPGASGKESSELIKEELRGFRFYPDPVRDSKEMRAESTSVAAEKGTIKVIRASWNDAFFEELDSWPNGAHRDQGDALSGAYNKIAGKSYNLERLLTM